MDDKLESLDNFAIRAKCKEYGLPNVPVTDSSRQVLIRRLRACMEQSTPKPVVEKRRNSYIQKSVSEAPVAKNSPSAFQKKRLSGSISKTRTTQFLQDTPAIASASTDNIKPQIKKLSRHSESFDPKDLNEVSSNFDGQNFSKNSKNADRDYMSRSEASDKMKGLSSQHDRYMHCTQVGAVSSHDVIPNISQNSYNSGIHIRHSTTFKQNVDHKDGVISTPYLSDFARSLERLKNEPLRLSSQKPGRLSSWHSEREWSHCETATKNPGNNSAGHILKTFLTVLERKYHLKLTLIIVFSLLLAVFIYVFFFM